MYEQLNLGSKSGYITWEEALSYVRSSKLMPSSIKGYWARELNNPKIVLDLEHVWDVSKLTELCLDFLMASLGRVDFFVIEH